MTPTIADAPFPKQPFLYDYGTTFHSSKTRSFVLNKLQAYHSPKTAQIRKTTANLGKDGLALAVYGDRRGLTWRQEEPNTLRVTSLDGPVEIWSRGQAGVAAASPAAARATRLPPGHPEGFLEAFANVYRNACDTIRARLLGEPPDPLALDFPTVGDGLRGMLFLEAAVKSAGSPEKWTRVPRA